MIKAQKELVEDGYDHNRIRKTGTGRKQITQKYPKIYEVIEKIIENDTLDDLERYILWITKA
ncbi:MAG: hypothetical protein LBP92_01590 [Deltaproteobacteria bacterium]|jgi:hypothetical protein|nr:hypothetical protein [Deltaproteobacteria bacterium]